MEPFRERAFFKINRKAFNRSGVIDSSERILTILTYKRVEYLCGINKKYWIQIWRVIFLSSCFPIGVIIFANVDH